MRNSLASWVALAALSLSRAAHADDVKDYPECTREPTETDLTAAKGAFQAGNASFDEADYPRAIMYWEDAYRRDCTAHALLLNLARAYELNGNKAQAVLSLQTYLQRVPTSPDKDKIERRIEVLERQIEAEKPVPPPTPAVVPPPAPPPASPPVSAPAPPPATDAGGKRSLAPLIVAGAGAGVAIVGVVLYATGRGDLSDAESQCPDHWCTSPNATDDGNSARRRVTTGAVLTVAGAVTTGAGIAWYFLQRPTAPATHSVTRRVLVPVAGPTFLGFSYAARF